ncbi:STAS domain-containing protein [Streptomyces sp. NPDC051597]|uniref:STAS domain-containing protein n=1 Tax=Streptomyces sp. NPDC051597 TaxID=3155049 RepID=UPI00342684B0
MDGALADESSGRLRVSSARGLGETLVVVAVGEVDFGTSPQLSEALARAVTSGVHRVLVDLGGVSFCDCSCVNVLLAARQDGLENGLVVVCEGLSPFAERVFELTGVGSLLRSA